MQKTTASAVTSKLSVWGFLILSVLLGYSAALALREAWSKNITWLLPLLVILAFSTALSKWAAGIINGPTAYRAAVLINFAIIISIWVVLWRESGTHPGFLMLGFSLLASVLGGMIVSWVQLGFTDETFIPTVEITAEIQQIYQAQNPHPPRPPLTKRLFDIFLAAVGILLSFPLWLAITLLIWLQDPGPLLFVKHCSGYQGKPFRLYKFRTMKINAEAETGPIASDQQDGRVLGVCRILRKTALDELPQLLNILVGEMSFVGPRPLRSVVEAENIHQIPGYTYRYNTLPGLAGLAQICGDNLMPSRNKLRYERIYAQHAGVLFDIKLVAIACLIVFYLRWTKDWDGRIPRAWIRFGS
jgi:lipopolysaccharide/colanic/teichoic acid biosynthesis glycosyltransferase